MQPGTLNVDVAATGTPVGRITTYATGQCTWWAAARRLQIGKPVDGYMGDGWMWASSARKLGYPTGGDIQLGDVASFTKGYLGASTDYGHVAIVEEIKDNGSIVISESGGGIPYAWLRTLTKEQANNPNITYYTDRRKRRKHAPHQSQARSYELSDLMSDPGNWDLLPRSTTIPAHGRNSTNGPRTPSRTGNGRSAAGTTSRNETRTPVPAHRTRSRRQAGTSHAKREDQDTHARHA